VWVFVCMGGGKASRERAYRKHLGATPGQVIARARDRVTATIPVGSGPLGVAVTPDGSGVYVTNFQDNTVSVIATASNTVTATIPLGNNPFGVAVTPGGRTGYAANQAQAPVAGTSSGIAPPTRPATAPTPP